MEKIIKNSLLCLIRYILVFSFLCSPFQISSECYSSKNKSTENETKDFTNYEELEEFEDIYREFEAEIDLDENSEIQTKGLFCWGKKIKKWFKKRTVRILKKFLGLKKHYTPEECAYMVAKFKRKIDKYYNTGSIETLLNDFDAHLPKDSRYDSFEAFKDRIRHYHYNKNDRPQHPDHDHHYFSVQCKKKDKDNSDHKKTNELENYPIRVVIGGVEIACGALIAVLPFPGCTRLGLAIATHGLNNIYEGYMQELEDEQKNNKNS